MSAATGFLTTKRHEQTQKFRVAALTDDPALAKSSCSYDQPCVVIPSLRRCVGGNMERRRPRRQKSSRFAIITSSQKSVILLKNEKAFQG